MNANEFANGSVIYTQSGYYAREFVKRTHGGMVGVNVGIPVPLGMFGFTGHRTRFRRPAHNGTDGVRFYTEQRASLPTGSPSGNPGSAGAQHLDGTISMPEHK